MESSNARGDQGEGEVGGEENEPARALPVPTSTPRKTTRVTAAVAEDAAAAAAAEAISTAAEGERRRWRRGVVSDEEEENDDHALALDNISSPPRLSHSF